MIAVFLADLFAEHSGQAADWQTYSYWKEFVNMLVMLGAILALIFITVWTLRRLMRSRTHQLNRSTGIKVLERRALGAKSALLLVDVLGKGIVLSESPSGIHLIAEFPPECNVELLLDQLSSQPKLSFKEMLKNKLKKRTNPQPAAPTEVAAVSIKRVQNIPENI